MINKSGKKNVGVQLTDLKLVTVSGQNMVALDYMREEGFRLEYLTAASSTLHGKPEYL